MDKTKSPPYEQKELGGILEHVKRGSYLVQHLSKDDPNYEDYLRRFFRLVDYFTACLDPIEEMRLLVDKRYESGGGK